MMQDSITSEFWRVSNKFSDRMVITGCYSPRAYNDRPVSIKRSIEPFSDVRRTPFFVLMKSELEKLGTGVLLKYFVIYTSGTLDGGRVE